MTASPHPHPTPPHRFVPELWGPHPPADRQRSSPRHVRCAVAARRPLSPHIASNHPALASLWLDPEIQAHPAVRRLALLLTPAVLAPLLTGLAHEALLLRAGYRERLGGIEAPLPLVIGNLADQLPDPFLARLALCTPDDAVVVVGEMAASRHRLAAIWSRAPATDWHLPERRAIEEGPDAMRRFIAAGGVFTDMPDPIGQTDAHVAAIATLHHPQALAELLRLGGPVHDKPDRHGRTPALHLVGMGRVEAVAAFLAAGGRLRNARDIYGADLLTTAEVSGPDMLALVRSALAEGGAP